MRATGPSGSALRVTGTGRARQHVEEQPDARAGQVGHAVQVQDGGRLGAVERGEQAGAQTGDALQVDVAREAEPQPTVRVVGRVELGGRVGAARGGRGAADGGSDRGHHR